ncbi:sensor histidine kinase [Spirosoma linguale]
MQSRTNWLGVFCALLLPTLGILNRDTSLPEVSAGTLAGAWCILSCFLQGVWLLNGQLYRILRKQPHWPVAAKLGIIILCDGLAITLFMALRFTGWLPHSLQAYSPQTYQLFLRLSFAVTLISTIQYAFLSLMQQQVLIRQNEQLRNENLVAELEGLKQQINPHLLFNSLGTLRAMIREHDEHAEQFVLRLSAVYRQFLSKRNETTIPLHEELDFLDNYLFMLRFRYEDQLTLLVEVTAASNSFRLPSFCLQLLVENCLKHNVLSATKPLSVRIYQAGGRTITVENNKQPKLTDVDSTGIGLDNLRKRYKLLGIDEGVTIRETETSFSVSVVLLDS